MVRDWLSWVVRVWDGFVEVDVDVDVLAAVVLYIYCKAIICIFVHIQERTSLLYLDGFMDFFGSRRNIMNSETRGKWK